MQSKLKKAKAWKDIASSFNAAGMGCQKSVTQLKRMWQHMKGK